MPIKVFGGTDHFAFVVQPDERPTEEDIDLTALPARGFAVGFADALILIDAPDAPIGEDQEATSSAASADARLSCEFFLPPPHEVNFFFFFFFLAPLENMLGPLAADSPPLVSPPDHHFPSPECPVRALLPYPSSYGSSP